jgi:hypothetical protein
MAFRQPGEWRYTSIRSQPRRQTEVIGQRHAPWNFIPEGKESMVPVECEAGWAAKPIWTLGDDVSNNLHFTKYFTLFCYLYCTSVFNNGNTSQKLRVFVKTFHTFRYLCGTCLILKFKRVFYVRYCMRGMPEDRTHVLLFSVSICLFH